MPNISSFLKLEDINVFKKVDLPAFGNPDIITKFPALPIFFSLIKFKVNKIAKNKPFVSPA
jgi:hypothetical protein